MKTVLTFVSAILLSFAWFTARAQSAFANSDTCSYCIFWTPNRVLQCSDFLGEETEFSKELLQNTWIYKLYTKKHPKVKPAREDASDGGEYIVLADIWADTSRLYAYSKVEVSVDCKISDDSLSFRAFAIFQKLSSYCNCQPDGLPIVLEHELVQFDIGEKNCRLLRKTLLQLPKAKISYHSIDSIEMHFNDMAWNEMQEFNVASMLGQRAAKNWQTGAAFVNEKYKKKLQKQLGELEKYSQPASKIAIK